MFLTAPEETLRERIRAQVLVPGDPERDESVRLWRLAQVEKGLIAAEQLRDQAAFLDSGALSPDELAKRAHQFLRIDE